MAASDEFVRPTAWEDVDLEAVDGLLLPGGHRARGMQHYLESPVLQSMVVDCFRRRIPTAAVCHGVLLAARSIDPGTGNSVLHGRRTTALSWSLEQRAWRVARVTRFWDPDYYRTYRERPDQPVGYLSVQREVTRALARPDDFCDVEPDDPDARLKQSGRARDTIDDERPAFVVRDGTTCRPDGPATSTRSPNGSPPCCERPPRPVARIGNRLCSAEGPTPATEQHWRGT